MILSALWLRIMLYFFDLTAAFDTIDLINLFQKRQSCFRVSLLTTLISIPSAFLISILPFTPTALFSISTVAIQSCNIA